MATAGNDIDYTETLKRVFGKSGWKIGMGLFIMWLAIPVILYVQLLSQLLYPIILKVIGDEDRNPANLKMNFNDFSYSYTVVIVFALLFSLTAKRDLSIFVRFNSYGVIFTIISISFIVGIGIYGLVDDRVTYNFTWSSKPAVKDDQGHWNIYIHMFGSGYSMLMGCLAGSYYLHNISLPIY